NWEGANILTSAPPGPVPPEVEPARVLLFQARAARTHPATDDKVVAGWNGIAISGLAEAGRLLGREDFVAAAVRAAEFLLTELRGADGRLMRSWRDGRTSGPAYLDDYALGASALLDVYETTFEERFFHEARSLADAMIALFADQRGGFHDTGSDADALVLRPKDLVDNAVPAGNSVAAEVLLRLSAFTGEAAYEERAAGALALVHDAFVRAPTGFGHALCALDAWANGVKEVALAGDPASQELRALARVAWERVGLPKALAAGSERIPLMDGRQPVAGAPAAYVCERFVCTQPVTDPSALAALLDA
ncbi:MAG: thioredoxin domain-containing protein, partial [Actinomycetota bacterium]